MTSQSGQSRTQSRRSVVTRSAPATTRPVTTPTTRERWAKSRSRSGRRIIASSRGGEQARCVDRELGPALARPRRELVHQRDGVGVVVAGPGLDPALGEHAVHDLPPDVGADDRERPVVELADPTGRDVGVLGREVRAGLAALTRPRVALLERHLVVVAVLHPDLEDALDVHLLHLGLLEAVLRLEQLLEDGVVERLGAQEPDVEREPSRDLARLAL